MLATSDLFMESVLVSKKMLLSSKVFKVNKLQTAFKIEMRRLGASGYWASPLCFAISF